MTRVKNRESVCIYCGEVFFHSDVKAKTCLKCQEIVEYTCSCGCGRVSTKERYRVVLNPFYINHQKKGKTYEEIYKSKKVGCGFKKGKDNPNYDPVLKKKSNEALSLYWRTHPELLEIKTKKGFETLIKKKGGFRFYDEEFSCNFNSSWERDFFRFLTERNIVFERERRVDLINQHIKLVDFVLTFNEIEKIYIEITGFSYVLEPVHFCNQMKILSKSINKYCSILILTEESLVEDIRLRLQVLERDNVYVDDFRNHEKVLKKIRLLKIINQGNLTLNNVVC